MTVAPCQHCHITLHVITYGFVSSSGCGRFSWQSWKSKMKIKTHQCRWDPSIVGEEHAPVARSCLSFSPMPDGLSTSVNQNLKIIISMHEKTCRWLVFTSNECQYGPSILCAQVIWTVEKFLSKNLVDRPVFKPKWFPLPVKSLYFLPIQRDHISLGAPKRCAAQCTLHVSILKNVDTIQ
jgi:hypothetical protein